MHIFWDMFSVHCNLFSCIVNEQKCSRLNSSDVFHFAVYPEVSLSYLCRRIAGVSLSSRCCCCSGGPASWQPGNVTDEIKGWRQGARFEIINNTFAAFNKIIISKPEKPEPIQFNPHGKFSSDSLHKL